MREKEFSRDKDSDDVEFPEDVPTFEELAYPHDPIISRNLEDLGIPGVQVEVDHDEAERLGLVIEHALDYQDAWEAADDLDIDQE